MKLRKIGLVVVAIAIVATIYFLNSDGFNPESAAGSIGGVEKADKYWQNVGVYKQRPEEQGEVVYIKGKVTRVDESRLDIEYGIESYFVPEGRGKEIENAIRSQDVAVEVAVTKSGAAIIKRLFLGDKAVDFKKKELK